MRSPPAVFSAFEKSPPRCSAVGSVLITDSGLIVRHASYDTKLKILFLVVFVPKRWRKAIFGQTRRQLGAIFHALARQKECQILEGHLMPDHVHMCIAIPPKPGPVGGRISEG